MSNESVDNKNGTTVKGSFQPILVSELLDGNYRFSIPSYQRGYRWSEREVKDLLDDLYSFMTNEKEGNIYFLQPIVVRPIRIENELWYEVLDGQQRLTTMRLILMRLLSRLPEEDRNGALGKLYKIRYQTRPDMDFDNPAANDNIDAFHASNAKAIIETWVNNKLASGKNLTVTKIAHALFYRDSPKKVCFIWYCVDEHSEVRESIGLFNRLNKGKIRLTGSELVKALFVLDEKEKGKDCVNRFSFEWDEIVRRFQHDSFWYFISNGESVQTRMDLLFEFVTGKSNDDDAYRCFQEAYDAFSSGEKSFIAFDKKPYTQFSSLWNVVTREFDVLLRWYEDVRAYNYIGWLIRQGETLHGIKQKWDSAQSAADNKMVTIDDHNDALRELIKEHLRHKPEGADQKLPLDEDMLAGLQYHNPADYKILRSVLLLFNIETYTKMGLRFPFEKYTTEKNWDLEHVDSQQDNNLSTPEEKMLWISFVLEVLEWINDPDTETEGLLDRGRQLVNDIVATNVDVGNRFAEYYSDVVEFFSADDNPNHERDGICNLTLLDAGTNRSYKNAPFPYKRAKIIERSRQGKFVPECTLNLFLKYYSDSGRDTSQIDVFKWNVRDQEKYFEAICNTLEKFLNGGN